MKLLNRLFERFARSKLSPAEEARNEVSRMLSQAEEFLRHGDQSGTTDFCVKAEEKLADLTKQPTTLESRKLSGDANFDIGSIYRDVGKFEEAEFAYRRALSAWKDLAIEFPQIVDFQERLAACFNHLGILYCDRGELDRAKIEYQSALAIREALQGAKFPSSEGNLENEVYLAGVLCNLGNMAAREGNSVSALEYYARADAMLLRAIPRCDCGCQLALAHAVSSVSGKPHWIAMGHHFLANIASGRFSVAHPIERDNS